eukprot:3380174-Rhodomonas_salina.1
MHWQQVHMPRGERGELVVPAAVAGPGASAMCLGCSNNRSPLASLRTNTVPSVRTSSTVTDRPLYDPRCTTRPRCPLLIGIPPRNPS